ncbi:hypothetical protein C0991_012499, partial [Blastosporella zonata]
MNLFEALNIFQVEDIAPVLKQFLDDHEMFFTDHPTLCATNEELEAFMYHEMKTRGLPSHLEKILHLSASLIE